MPLVSFHDQLSCRSSSTTHRGKGLILSPGPLLSPKARLCFGYPTSLSPLRRRLIPTTAPIPHPRPLALPSSLLTLRVPNGKNVTHSIRGMSSIHFSCNRNISRHSICHAPSLTTSALGDLLSTVSAETRATSWRVVAIVVGRCVCSDGRGDSVSRRWT